MIFVLSAIFVFGILVILHELGHFFAAKLSGIKVLEFGIGYPPRVLKFTYKETIYSINLLPLGGFVRLLGEEDASLPGSLASKSKLTRFIVLAAGSFVNAVLPIIIFSILFMIPQDVPVTDILVSRVAPQSPAASAGLRQGDIIKKVDGKTVDNGADLMYRIQLNLGNEIDMEFERAGAPMSTSLKPRYNPPDGEGSIGVQYNPRFNLRTVERSDPPWVAIPKGFQRTWETLVIFKNGIAQMITGGGEAREVAGPIGIAKISGEVAREGFSPLFTLVALLSLNLAIINMLPIPALDGGRVLFLVIEAIRGKPIPAKKEALVHMIGFAILITLVVVISYFDIARIVSDRGSN